MTKIKLALVIGTTRPTRFADKPAAWLLDVAAARDDLDLEILELRDFDLPFFDDMASEAYMPSKDPRVVAWQQAVAKYDGYIFMTAEYNHSISGALKNALDQAYTQWGRKPMSAMGYGGVGGARAVEHLRTIAVELQMAPSRFAVHLGGGEILKVHPMGQNLEMAEVDAALRPSAEAMLNDLVWWAKALNAGRQEAVAKAA